MNNKRKKQTSDLGAKNKRYWSSLDEYNDIPDIHEDKLEDDHKSSVLELFDEKISGSRSSRRDFLKLFGFSLTSAALAASCEKPVQKAIPYVIQPEEIIPGKSLHYASTFYDGKDYCNVVVKTRDGRPIKIEGNSLSVYNRGGTTARVQASVLSLYDDARYKEPQKNGKNVRWEEVDSSIIQALKEINNSDKEVVLLSSTLISPTTQNLIEEFSANYKNFHWVQYDAVSHYSIRKAYKALYGSSVIPDLRFEKADVVVGFGADFLGSWLAPAHFIPLYAERKKLHSAKKDMLRHYQFESGMTVTGSNADHRFPIKPEAEKNILIYLYNRLAEHLGQPPMPSVEIDEDISYMVEDLISAGSRSLIVSGSNDFECQVLVAGINKMLGALGATVDMDQYLKLAAGNDEEMVELVEKLNSGKVGALLIDNVNPVYDYPDGTKLGDVISKLDLSISFAWSKNETSERCQYICPVHHYLESWDDAEVIPGHLSLMQPAIRPLFHTRSMQDSLLKWMGRDVSYQSYLTSAWEQRFWDRETRFEDFWIKCLQEGIYNYKTTGEGEASYNTSVLENILPDTLATEKFSIVMSESIQMGDGKYANNPWLQELPDPIAKVSWDNFLSLSPNDASKLDIHNGDLVLINDLLTVPVLIQPGQAESSVSISLGYGRLAAGKVGDDLGVNAFKLIEIKDGIRKYFIRGASLKPTGENILLALTQTHNSMEGRPIVREANLDEYLESPDAGNELHEEYESHHKTLYPDVEFVGFHWGLAVDLNACVGCNTCVISCQAENNIPVVGKSEVYRRRIMHWIKIDRYYSEDPSNPKVSYQPNLCQHCDNAPCENVCPVSATNHSSEGI
ncbi:MAG: TAT-variant-translocated molybdopterin oxidoreductase, partial [bacterium]